MRLPVVRCVKVAGHLQRLEEAHKVLALWVSQEAWPSGHLGFKTSVPQSGETIHFYGFKLPTCGTRATPGSSHTSPFIPQFSS